MLHAFEWLLAAAALGLGATVQSASGFGLAIVSVPLLTASGRSLPEAVALAVGAGIVQASLGLRASGVPMPWAPAARIAAGQWMGVPLGVALMALLITADVTHVKQVIGVVVLISISLHLWVKPVPRPHLHWAWAPATGLVAGLISGAVGMGGPPLVFFGLAHDWQRDQFRSFMWRQMLINAPLLIGVLCWRFGGQLALLSLQGVACVPLLYLGTRLGLTASRRWSREQLGWAAGLLLYGMGIAGLLAPWLR